MLAKLFTLSAGSGSSPMPHAGQPSTSPEPVSSLDSVQEDLHTRSLLFPEVQALLQSSQDQIFPLPNGPHLPASSSSSSSFDYDGTLDLDVRDLRVLIMQDGISSVPSCLLYDSQPPPVPPILTTADRSTAIGAMADYSHGVQDASRRTPTSPRKPSISGQATRPVVTQPGCRSPSRPEIDMQRTYREYSEEISIISSCVFGNSELLAYRGTSTKLHVLPPEQRTSDSSALLSHDGRGSLGRSSMRSSKLSQSFSSESAAMFSHNQPASSTLSPAAGTRSADRNRVLITRLFPVPLSNDDDTGISMTPQSRYSEESGTNSYPFPSSYTEDPVSLKRKKKAHLKQKRTPMYAIALIVNLPQPPLSPVQSNSTSRSTFKNPGSYTEHDSFPSSFGSGRRVGWALATAAVTGKNSKGLNIDEPDSEANESGGSGNTVPGGKIGATTDLEERMDPITQHWDIIMRSLTQLQTVASATILALLRASDTLSSDQYPPSASIYARSTSFNARQDGLSGSVKPNKTNAKLVTLLPNALADVDKIAREVDIGRSRIAVGLRALRVVTGQNRWGIWREEARWVSRWAAVVREKRQQQKSTQPQALDLQVPPLQLPSYLSPQQGHGENQFLYNLLTAFLSTHTDWLQALSPASYRKRHLLLHSSKRNDDSIPARTLIVSRDKIAARRIIFLLSAFLPANQNLATAVRVHRPSTSALSQSPPASIIVPIIKEQSLRRKINRHGPGDGGGRRLSHSRNLSLQGQAVTGVHSTTRSASMSVAGVLAPLAYLNPQRRQHERRPSDTASIRSANLPFTGNDSASRKSSVATTTTITSNATVPHFATMQRSQSSLTARPESRASSAAADDLKRNLRRDDSNSSQNGSGLLALQQQQGPLSPGLDADSRNQGARWGNMLPGFLSSRRRDSTSSIAGLRGGHSRSSSITSWDPLGRRNSLLSQTSPSKSRQEAGVQSMHYPLRAHTDGPTISTVGLASTAGKLKEDADPFTQQYSRDNLNPTTATFAGLESFRRGREIAAFDSPVKATNDADDGVIDVDIAFPDYIRSFETAVSSPSSSGLLSTPGLGSGLDYFEQSCRVSVDGDLPINVAGWLQSYHPDFCLQAVPPQGNLMAQIKESLRTEPSPPPFAYDPDLVTQQYASTPGERWVDVSSAIVVDTARLAITRVSYSRLLRPKSNGGKSTPNSGNGPPTPVTGTVPVQEMVQLDERFVEEPIVSTDSVLTKAIERVIAHGIANNGINTSRETDIDYEHLNVHSGAETTAKTAESSVNSAINSARSSRSASLQRSFRDSSSGRRDETHPPPSNTRFVDPSPPVAHSSLKPRGLEEVPRAECKSVILSALEEIVRDVVQSKDRDDQTTDGSQSDANAASASNTDVPDPTGKEEPSVLRSAVQSWLESIDMCEL
ncbi:hypothetical protein SEPCBS57363_000292 [Sporothrix epigloea]|uniref:Folliculin-interacting protein N-terminal domain-containing protein n=1 Tax=Sporothrix epigloea TaxID=1892477 RepID=A0ABP0D3V8_9PEZI